jgi:hypothetical protein
MSVFFHATILAVSNVRCLQRKISFNVHLHGQMSVKASKCPFLKTFGSKFEVYNTEMQIYGHMSVNNAFIIQATELT